MANEIRDAFRETFRDYVVEGIPSSGNHRVDKKDARNLGDVVQTQFQAAAAGNIAAATWAQLASTPGSRVGQPGQVSGNDTGTHTDPVVGGSVANSGEYRWSGSGWQRTGDVIDPPAILGRIGDTDASLQSYTLPVQGDDAFFVDDWLRVLLADKDGNVIAGVDMESSLRGQFRDYPGVPALTEEYSYVIATEDGYVIAAYDRNFRPVSVGSLDLSGFTDDSATPRVVAIRAGKFVPVTFGEVASFFVKAENSVLSYAVKAGSTFAMKSEDMVLSNTLSAGVSKLVLIPGYGQSLSIGVATGAPISIEAVRPGRALSFSVGARLNGSFDPNMALDSANVLGLIDLKEISVETPASGIGYQVTAAGWLLATEAAIVFAAGRSATAYAGLKKGTQPYANLMEGIRRASIFARGLGMGFSVPVVTWIHGEQNQTESLAAYLGHLTELQADLSTDIAAYTGSVGDVLVCEDQPSNWTAYLTKPTTSDVGLAMLKAAQDNPAKFICVGPKYHLPHAADGVHLTAASSARLGDFHGRAIRQHLGGSPWLPLHVATAVRSGPSVVLNFAGGSGDISLDTSLVSDPGNYGIEWFQTGGTPCTISSAAKTGARELTVTLTGDPGSPTVQQIGIARTGISGQNGGPTTGPRSCIRDSATDLDRAGVAMRNYACHQLITVS